MSDSNANVLQCCSMRKRRVCVRAIYGSRLEAIGREEVEAWPVEYFLVLVYHQCQGLGPSAEASFSCATAYQGSSLMKNYISKRETYPWASWDYRYKHIHRLTYQKRFLLINRSIDQLLQKISMSGRHPDQPCYAKPACECLTVCSRKI
jgi:hypothetical protein